MFFPSFAAHLYWSTLFVPAADFGFGHLGGHIVLAAWGGLRAMPASPFPLFALYIYILSQYYIFFWIQESLATLQWYQRNASPTLQDFYPNLYRLCKLVVRKNCLCYEGKNLWHHITEGLRKLSATVATLAVERLETFRCGDFPNAHP